MNLDVTFTNLSQLSRAYGTPAVDMATQVLQRSAWGQLIGSITLLVISVIFGVIATILFVLVHRDINKPFSDQNEGLSIGCAVGGVVLCVLGIVTFAFTIPELVDVWMWTALTDPKLALAHQIFGSMGGS